MSEIVHPLFDAHIMPDLGGTSYDFAKEIGRDRLTFFHRSGDNLTKVEIPGEDYLRVSLSEGFGRNFFEANYKFTGELASATLSFRNYCEQKDFERYANPSDEVMETYWQLMDRNEDLRLKVDLDAKTISVTHGKFEKNGGFREIAVWEDTLPENEGVIFQMQPLEGDDIGLMDFAVLFEDNILSMGVRTNEKDLAVDMVSGFATSSELSFTSTPKDLRRFLHKVFLKVV